MNSIWRQGLPRIGYGKIIPWQFVIKAAVDWAREAVDVAAVSSDASRRRAPAQSYTEVPPLQVELPLLAAAHQERSFYMYAEEMVCLVLLSKVDAAGAISVAAAITAVKNYARSGVGKALFKDHKWANRGGIMQAMQLLRSVGLLAGFVEFEGEECTPILAETAFPPWIYSFTVKTLGDAASHIVTRIFEDRLKRNRNQVGTAVPRSVGGMDYMDTVGNDWPACLDEASQLFKVLQDTPEWWTAQADVKGRYEADADSRAIPSDAIVRVACVWLVESWVETAATPTVKELLRKGLEEFQAFVFEAFISDAYNMSPDEVAQEAAEEDQEEHGEEVEES